MRMRSSQTISSRIDQSGYNLKSQAVPRSLKISPQPFFSSGTLQRGRIADHFILTAKFCKALDVAQASACVVLHLDWQKSNSHRLKPVLLKKAPSTCALTYSGADPY